MIACHFKSIEDQFNFGRYNGLSLADVMDINPSYLSWCIKYCTGVIFQLQDEALEEIKIVYPNFIMDALFESKRVWHLFRDDCEYYDEYCYDDEEQFDNEYDDMVYDNTQTYHRYSGSWAQDIEGYSDDDIDTIFDGDPSAYWNID